MQSEKLFPSPINQNQSISIVVDGLQSNMSYQFTSMVQSVTGEVMFSTMAAYTTGKNVSISIWLTVSYDGMTTW